MSAQQDAIVTAVSRGFGWLRFLAVLPPLMTAIAFAIAWQRWGSDYATVMAKTVQLQFLVIHAGLFIGVFIMVPVESALFRVLRWVAVTLFATMYLRGGYGLLGWKRGSGSSLVLTHGDSLRAFHAAFSPEDARSRSVVWVDRVESSIRESHRIPAAVAREYCD